MYGGGGEGPLTATHQGKETVLHMQEAEAKEALFHQLFQTQVNHNPGNKKLVDTTIVCTSPTLRAHFNKLYQKFRGQMNRMDFMSECTYWSYQAVTKFTLLDGNWRDVLDGKDQKNMNKILSYIKITVGSNAIRFSNPDTQFTTRSINGQQKHVKIVLELSSLDAMLFGEDGTPTALEELIDTNQNLWGRDITEYKMNHFTQWFHATKHTFLRDSQLRLLENLPKALNDNGTFNGERLKEECGITANNLPVYLERIKTRALNEWEEQFPNGHKTLTEVENAQRKRKLKHLHKLLEEEDCDDQRIINWLAKHGTDGWMHDLATEEMNTEELVAYNRALNTKEPPERKLLYPIINKLEEAYHTYEEQEQNYLDSHHLPNNEPVKPPTSKAKKKEGTKKDRRRGDAPETNPSIYYLTTYGTMYNEEGVSQ